MHKLSSNLRLVLAVVTVLYVSGFLHAKDSIISDVYPPNWWTGMADTKLEIIFHGENIQQFEVLLEESNSVITGITKPQNKNYIFVELNISATQEPGELHFRFQGKKKKAIAYNYPLMKRENTQQTRGISSNDLIYLVFPDRFSNGDTSNDAFAGMQEKKCDRLGLKTRHGGDLKGIEDHLDYIAELGVTALWINPVLENDQPEESYHGYAATDLYKVDPRLGTNAQYRKLSAACHNRGIRMIWDVVYNHWGNQNTLFKDLPDSNWIHWYPQFTRTSYRAEVLLDPYASKSDQDIMANAWFDKHMPDLNQKDPHLATLLIQNSIWWIEYAGLDAFRIDTYAYPDQQFMKALNESILRQYPDFVLFGETWVQGSPVQAWFTGDALVNKTYSSSLHGVTDFQLYYAINKGLTEKFGWEEGFRRIELTLSHDVLYKDPQQLVTFLDNHDLSRFFSMVNEDIRLYKMGIAMLYTLRGIPSIYYGTEILMKNYSDPDAKVREDFPGGWASDKLNKFKASGRNDLENEAHQFCKALGQWRKNNSWFGRSNLMQFVPEENTYVYFRYDDEHALMCIYNGNEEKYDLNLSRFTERIKGSAAATNIISNSVLNLSDILSIPSKTVMLLELK